MKFISTSLALAALVSALYTDPQGTTTSPGEAMSEAMKSAAEGLKSAAEAVKSASSAVNSKADNLTGKYAEARDNINYIAKYATSYNASTALRKVQKECMSVLDSLKPASTIAEENALLGGMDTLLSVASSALGEIVHEDFMFMAYSVHRNDAGVTFDSKLQEKKMSLDVTKETENKIQSEADTLRAQFIASVVEMDKVIIKTQRSKATIDLLNSGAKKEDLEKPENEHKIYYRITSKTTAQVADYADSLLRSDAMTVAVSALTTVFATVAIAGAFFM